jgi:hypothetical protein
LLQIALFNAIKVIFPFAKNLLCGWYILSCAKTLKVYATNSDEETTFLSHWQSLVNCIIIADFEKEWRAFQESYQNVPNMLKYLQTTWINEHKEKFIQCWADRALHFGN